MLTIPAALSDVYSPRFLGDFEASHPGIKVQVKKQDAAISAPAADLEKHFDSVQKYVMTGDVLYLTTGNFVYLTAGSVYPEDTAAGYYLDLMPLVKEDKTLNPDDFYPTIWQSYQWDNGIWALPVSADPLVLLYNPDVFDKAGLPYPSDQWTADDLINTVRALTVKDATGVVKAGIDIPALQEYALLAMMKTSNLDTVTVPNTPKFDTPELADMVSKWLKLEGEGAIGTDIGKAPLGIAPAAWLALRQRYYYGERRSAALLPGGRAVLSVDGFAVSGGTQYPEQAYALAAWFTTRPESSNRDISSTTARISLKSAPGSDQLTYSVNIPPDVQAVIDQAVEKAVPLSELRFADYFAVAYNNIKSDKIDVTATLQNAENDAIITGTGAAFLQQLWSMVHLALRPQRFLLLLADGTRWIRGFFTDDLDNITHKRMILDWYHLHQRCRVYCRRIVTDCIAQATLLRRVSRRLWQGKVDSTLRLLERYRAPAHDTAALDSFIAYPAARQPWIPNYRQRRIDRRYIGSGRAEKANDLVAKRQKRGGM